MLKIVIALLFFFRATTATTTINSISTAVVIQNVYVRLIIMMRCPAIVRYVR